MRENNYFYLERPYVPKITYNMRCLKDRNYSAISLFDYT